MSPHRLSAAERRGLGLRRLKADVAAPAGLAAVRADVRDLADGVLSPDRLADALLATSELVSNSLCHAGGGAITVWAGVDERRLRVEVHDEGPGVQGDDWRLPSTTSHRGRGLPLVAILSDRVGHRAAPWAAVWFEIEG